MSFAAIMSDAGEGWTRFPEERAPMKEALSVDYERLYAEDIAPTRAEVDLTELIRERIEAATRGLDQSDLSERRRSNVLLLLTRIQRVV